MHRFKYLIAACLLTLTVGAANADTINTFVINGTFAADPVFGTPASTLSGTFTVDDTIGQIIAADLIVPSFADFTTILSSTNYNYQNSPGWQEQFISGNYVLTLNFTAPDATNNTLSGFNGGTIMDGNVALGSSYCAVLCDLSGNIAPTPLPAAFPLFASGLGAFGLLGWRRRRKAAAVAA